MTDATPVEPPRHPARPGPLAGFLLFLTVAVLAGFSAWILQPGGHPAPPPPDRSVPWPAGVQVDPETFRMTTLPTASGPYRLAQDGELTREKDGRPDGEMIFGESVLQSLNIGMPSDRQRHGCRRSNWYVYRIYLDTRTFKADQDPVPSSFSIWYLDVTYRTGELKLGPPTVENPYIPPPPMETGNTQFAFKAPPGQGRRWTGPIPFKRVVSERPGVFRKSVDYCVFALNGRPESSPLAVRAEMLDPRARRSCYAKIQFGPKGDLDIDDLPAADRAAGEFLQAFLPEVLQCLPTPEDLNRH